MSDLEVRDIASGLRFPEGPVALPDGSVVLVEIARGTLSRVDVATGEVTVVAEVGGGPNGAAVGPDGAVYLCNNGGYFEWMDHDGLTIPIAHPEQEAAGSIQRVDLATGAVTTLYDSVDGQPLVAPNDLVFDAHGGFWFTDHGVHGEHHRDRPGLLHAAADGSAIRGVALGTDGANGVGLSPAGDRVYVAETHVGRLWAWDVTGPGEVAPVDGGPVDGPQGAQLLYDAPDGHLYDSLAVDDDGWVCVATIGVGGITAVAPDGSAHEHHPLPDPIVTNICFSATTPDGDDDPERRTAYVTCSATGKLVAMRWPRPGLRLAH